MKTVSPTTRFTSDIMSLALGLFGGAMIYFYPEGLRVPAWVALVAVSAFVFAGLSLVASASRANRFQGWLIVLLTLSLFAPGAWIAFGPGERKCPVSLPFLESLGADVLCRGAFGLGSIIVAAIFVLAVRRAIRSKRIDA